MALTHTVNMGMSDGKSPAVDILIPFHGQYEMVSALVEGLLRSTRGVSYSICLIDDGSPNTDFLNSMSRMPRVKIVRSPEHKGFGHALWMGFQATENPLVAMLNSDCVIRQPQWLLEMMRSLAAMRPAGVRMVSATSNNPGPSAPHQLKSARPEFGPDIVLEDGFLPLYCVLCQRALFARIGGFIRPYPLGMYEDEELYWRMKKYGFKQGVAGKSWVFHHGGATVEAVCKQSPEAAEIMESNRERCLADVGKLYSSA